MMLPRRCASTTSTFISTSASGETRNSLSMARASTRSDRALNSSTAGKRRSCGKGGLHNNPTMRELWGYVSPPSLRTSAACRPTPRSSGKIGDEPPPHRPVPRAAEGAGPPSMLIARVVRRVHVGERERSQAVHLDGGPALRPSVAIHVFRHAHESAGFQKTSTRLVKLVSHPGGRTKLEHASHLCHELTP